MIQGLNHSKAVKVSTVSMPQKGKAFLAGELDAKSPVERARRLHRQLLSLNRQIDQGFLEAGIYLKEIRDQGLYQMLHHDSFSSYLKKVKFSRSRAYALIGVTEDFYLSSRLDKNRLLILGWEKLSLLRLVKDHADFLFWLDKALNLGKRQLRQELRSAGELGSIQVRPKPKPPIEIVAKPHAKGGPAVPEKTVYYFAVKKLTAVKLLSPEQVKKAKITGVYPLIVGVIGAAHLAKGNPYGLPSLDMRSPLPLWHSAHASGEEDFA